MILPGLEALPSASDETVRSCARCHGVDGRGRGSGPFPRLAGQRREYLEAALGAYVSGGRPSGVMEPVAAALDDAELRDLARYYAEMDASSAAVGLGPGVRPAPSAPDFVAAAAREPEPDLERGKALARQGDPGRRIPSCVDCHGPRVGSRNARYPHLAGQHQDYLLLQLRLFAEGRRGGSSYAHVMEEVAANLSDDDMRDVAAWYASLPWPR